MKQFSQVHVKMSGINAGRLRFKSCVIYVFLVFITSSLIILFSYNGTVFRKIEVSERNTRFRGSHVSGRVQYQTTFVPPLEDLYTYKNILTERNKHSTVVRDIINLSRRTSFKHHTTANSFGDLLSNAVDSLTDKNYNTYTTERIYEKVRNEDITNVNKNGAIKYKVKRLKDTDLERSVTFSTVNPNTFDNAFHPYVDFRLIDRPHIYMNSKQNGRRLQKKPFRNSLRNFDRKRIFLNRFSPAGNISNEFNELKYRIRLSQIHNKHHQWNGSIDASLPIRNDSCSSCFKINFAILINQEKLCKQTAEVDILILISSAPKEYYQRKAIRDTWGSNCNKVNSSIKCVFVIGNPRDIFINTRNDLVKSDIIGNLRNADEKSTLDKESDFFKDILQFDFIDSYGNLTYKTLSGLHWAVKFCPSAKFVMKTDTDMFVNTELLPILVAHAPQTFFIGGYCWGPSFPNRDPLSKWFVSYNLYRHDKFPAMCSGTGYIMSKDVVKSVIRKSHNIPFFHLEDVYISLCLNKTDIKPIQLAGFSNILEPFEGCNYKNYVITSHHMTPELLYEYWKPLKSCNITIPSKYVYREL